MKARMESMPWKFVAAECGDQHATSVRSPELLPRQAFLLRRACAKQSQWVFLRQRCQSATKFVTDVDHRFPATRDFIDRLLCSSRSEFTSGSLTASAAHQTAVPRAA